MKKFRKKYVRIMQLKLYKIIIIIIIIKCKKIIIKNKKKA